jgi:hypothetical protein
VRVAVAVRLEVVEEFARLQVLDDPARDPVGVQPRQPVEAADVVPVLGQRRHDG